MSDLINYQYGNLDEGIANLQSINRTVEGLIETLARETGSALDNWTGDAAIAYNAAADRVRTNFGDLNTIVHELAVTLKDRANEMKQQDRRSGGGF